MKKNVKITKVCIYIAVLGVLAIVYFNLNYLVGQFWRNETNNLKVVDFADYEVKAKDKVYNAGAPVVVNDDDFETVYVAGRCSASPTSANERKTVTILFKSAERCYASERKTTMGGPPEEAPSQYGYNHNYSREIATLPMKEGTYELYLFCWENEETYGLLDLNQSIVKDKRGVRLREKTVDFDSAAVISADGTVCLDYVKLENSTQLQIEGWVWCEDVETEGQRVYLELSTPSQTKYILCDTVLRTGVSDVFGNEKYDYSGYVGIADPDWIGTDLLQIRVIMENDNGYHTNGLTYIWNPTTDEVTSDENKNEVRIAEKTVEFDTSTEIISDAAVCLDYAKLTALNRVEIEGWVWCENVETEGQRVYLELSTPSQTKYILCDTVLRTGVSEVFENEKYDYSGYFGIADPDWISTDLLQIRIIMENESGYHTNGLTYVWNPVTGELE